MVQLDDVRVSRAILNISEEGPYRLTVTLRLAFDLDRDRISTRERSRTRKTWYRTLLLSVLRTHPVSLCWAAFFCVK